MVRFASFQVAVNLGIYLKVAVSSFGLSLRRIHVDLATDNKRLRSCNLKDRAV
jgi:hypothetical protein